MVGTQKILVVEDETDIRNMLIEYLTGQGFYVRGLEDGSELRHVLTDYEPDVVLMDVNLPGEDGLSLTRFLREHSRCGIIMITGQSSLVDKVVGLEIGADDYIAKPFELREVLARIRSLLRRTEVRPNGRTEEASSVDTPANSAQFGPCRIQHDTRQLIDANGDAHALTSMEYDLLNAFVRHPNQVLSRDQLLDLAHNRDWEPFDRSVDVRITRLRRKIEIDPSHPNVIRTVRGFGYIFVP